MFIGFYRLENEEYFDIYYKNKYGYEEWRKNTFSPDCEDITIFDFKISGKTYNERKASLQDLAIDFSNSMIRGLDWSYGELATICNYFYKMGKRYGLLKEFRENCIC